MSRTLPFCRCALLVLICSTGLIVSCKESKSGQFQGYVEGEYVYIASPLAGTLDRLNVSRGTHTNKGDELFVLENAAEKAGREEAERRVLQAKASLEDIRKGKRPSEIASLEAQLKQAEAALKFSETEARRLEGLSRTGATSAHEVDRARATRDVDQQRVVQLQAELKTAGLGQREDQISAAEANLLAMEAALARAAWDLSQKRQVAPADALVFDTFYREGEWVAAGKPVVALLPPGNIKVRAFIPEGEVGKLQPGHSATVQLDGVAGSLTGKISYLSPRAEFTPPVIYSRESRGKLVFMVEIVFDAETSARLHPGQPVDVQFGN